MRQLEEHAVIAAFLNQVCKHVRAKELHADIREELSSHVADRMEILLGKGMPEEEAAAEAVRQMGDPNEIGRNLHRAHKPAVEWKILVIIAVMALIGIFGVFTVQQSGMYPQFGGALFERKVLFTLMGMVCLMAFYFVDYRKIQKHSATLFYGMLLLMLFTLYEGIDLNGRKVFLAFGNFGVNMMAISLPILILALAGMKQAKEWRGVEHLFQLIGRGVIPVLLFCQGFSWFYGCIYLASFFVLTWMTKRNGIQFLLLALPLLSLYIFALTQVGQLYHRLHAYLYPVWEDSYQLIQTKAAIHSAGWFGHGFAARLDTLPYAYGDSLFPYLIYCFGWGFGILIAGLVVWFIARFWKMNALIQDEYAKRILIGFTSLFAIRMLWPILMSLGIVPIVGEVLPFMGYSNMMQVFDFAAVGLLLSVFRRKNMIPRAAEGALPRH
ncbi:FtsW/RodA/SpoVE family cell cycle protein [Paenibacillus sp. VCA1]|uniref:FtsW/RodA/SpoVE family cell cycle protein n=1 Tax=Paenibacillus sp. VCA1 TaxID=3039148 RepID=UPI002872089F|nr:FtsW/RodA/SpoVE family cell cycle protein [Paenibacillus sp. VCA1]MDR9852083.1 FtsW/RodA/SpoVE family cell cycle protein [Paenibacillus sp. VCA1]